MGTQMVYQGGRLFGKLDKSETGPQDSRGCRLMFESFEDRDPSSPQTTLTRSCWSFIAGQLPTCCSAATCNGQQRRRSRGRLEPRTLASPRAAPVKAASADPWEIYPGIYPHQSCASRPGGVPGHQRSSVARPGGQGPDVTRCNRWALPLSAHEKS